MVFSAVEDRNIMQTSWKQRPQIPCALCGKTDSKNKDELLFRLAAWYTQHQYTVTSGSEELADLVSEVRDAIAKQSAKAA